MTDTQRALNDTAKLMTKLMQKNNRLEAEVEELKKEVARWQNTFLAFAEYHFNEGGTAPNLPYSRIKCTETPEFPYSIIDNIEYITLVMR